MMKVRNILLTAIAAIAIILVLSLVYIFGFQPNCDRPYMIKNPNTGECKLVIACNPPKDVVNDDSCLSNLFPDVYADLNESVKLFSNQTLSIKHEDLKLKIVGFANSPCPDGVQCIWSGVGIFYEITSNNETKRYTSELGSAVIVSDYQIIVEDSDYDKYAMLHVIKK